MDGENTSPGFTYDPVEALARLSGCDAELAALIREIGEFRLPPPGEFNPFSSLLRAIVYQQLSGRAAGRIHERVLALLPAGGAPHPDALKDVPDTALREAGLSRAKTAALRDLAARMRDGTVPPGDTLVGLADEEIVARLTTVRGVGRWTAEMLLIFGLGRADVLPVSDLGIRKGYAHLRRMARLPTPAELTDGGAHWAPYRSVASWYLWRASELAA